LTASHLVFIDKVEAAGYVVKAGDCLSKIGVQLKVNWRQIAQANKINKPFIIRVGQVLNIPESKSECGYKPWLNHGAEPYIKNGGEQLASEVFISGLNYLNLPVPVKKIFTEQNRQKQFTLAYLEIGDKREEMLFDNGSVAKRIIVAEKREPVRRYQAIWGGRKYILDDPFVCHNLCWASVTLISPPSFTLTKMPPPPEPPKMYNKFLEQVLIGFKKLACPECQLDLSGGGSWQDYSDGAEDYSDWIYAALRCQVWTDSEGREHKAAIYFNGTRWNGNWKDVVDFEGKIKTFGIEHRILNQQDREYIFRMGYLMREDKANSSDIWGKYDTKSKFNALVFESSVDDMSRFNEFWFPRMKAGIGLITELSSKRNSKWTEASTGKVVDLNEAPDTIGGMDLKADVDIFNDPWKLTTISVEGWANFLFDGDRVAKLTPYFGILGDSLKVGYQMTDRRTNGSHATGNGLAWQVHLYDLYTYIKYEGWKKREKDKDVFHPSDPFSALNDNCKPNSGSYNRNNPFGVLERTSNDGVKFHSSDPFTALFTLR
jgi:LysM repeat protein